MALASPLLHVWVTEKMNEDDEEPKRVKFGGEQEGGEKHAKEMVAGETTDGRGRDLATSVKFAYDESVIFHDNELEDHLSAMNGEGSKGVSSSWSVKAGKRDAVFSVTDGKESETDQAIPAKVSFPSVSFPQHLSSSSSPMISLDDKETQIPHWNRKDYSDTLKSPLPPSSPPLNAPAEASLLLQDFISELGMKMKAPIPTLHLPPLSHPPARISPPPSPLHSSLVSETSPRSLLAKHRASESKIRKRVRWADSHGEELTKVFSAHSRFVYDRRPAIYTGRQYDDYLHLNLSSVCVLVLIIIAIVASYHFAS